MSEDRYANAHARLTRAATLLLADSSPEGQTFLHLLIDNQLYGDELMTAVESAERYLRERITMTYFHGSTRELEKFDPGIVYLAVSFEDAKGFVEWGAEPGDPRFVYEVEARPGEMIRQDAIVPGSGWSKERETGARYVSFTHDDGMEVVVSFYPDEDLRITRKEKL